jgi:glycosyltransferase involved in cell wall biosynthesis
VSLKIAYLMSRFPKISETFILYEILEVQRNGIEVEIFPLIREQETASHPEAAALSKRACFTSLLSLECIAAQFYWLLKKPAAYVRAWIDAIIGNAISPKFLLRALFAVPLAATFARKMVKNGIQHIHAHWATHPALAAYVVHQLTKIPYSVTAHAHDLYVERPMLRVKLESAAFIVTISEYNKRFLRALFGPNIASKTHVIHCGVDTDLFRPEAKSSNSRPFTILCVASLNDYKGHSYLIDACKILRETGVDFVCLLAGDGELRQEIEQRIQNAELTKYVSILGWKTRNEINTLMANADVFVLPSIETASGKKEGIPVALMEALAMELPVVATSISGVPELVSDSKTGLLVQEKDPQSLAEAIYLLYERPELRTFLGRSGRAKVQREFNLHQNSATLSKLFLGSSGELLETAEEEGSAQC